MRALYEHHVIPDNKYDIAFIIFTKLLAKKNIICALLNRGNQDILQNEVNVNASFVSIRIITTILILI